MSRHVTPSLDYIRKLYAPQSSLLASIDELLVKLGQAIHIGPEEGKLLQFLIQLHGAKRIVEIGTLAGYSALWMAEALPQDGELHTITIDPDHAQMAAHFFDQSPHKNKLFLYIGDAHQILPTLKGEFDLAFIDAEKPGYGRYLDWAEQRVRKGGLIIADNTLLKDSVALDAPPPNIAPATWQAMRDFNQRLADPARYLSVIIPTQEGLSVAMKLF